MSDQIYLSYLIVGDISTSLYMITEKTLNFHFDIIEIRSF